MGRLGPANRKPVPETVTRLMVTVDFPLFVTARGCTIVLPTCTVPKATGFAVSDCEESRYELCSARAGTESRQREIRSGVQKAGLRGDPRQSMSVALFLLALTGAGGGFVELENLAA
jgi:hypothetical protein